VRVCGVDDAGRGPVIGPLVIAGVIIEEEKLEKLKTLGVTAPPVCEDASL